MSAVRSTAVGDGGGILKLLYAEHLYNCQARSTKANQAQVVGGAVVRFNTTSWVSVSTDKDVLAAPSLRKRLGMRGFRNAHGMAVSYGRLSRDAEESL